MFPSKSRFTTPSGRYERVASMRVRRKDCKIDRVAAKSKSMAAQWKRRNKRFEGKAWSDRSVIHDHRISKLKRMHDSNPATLDCEESVSRDTSRCAYDAQTHQFRTAAWHMKSCGMLHLSLEEEEIALLKSKLELTVF